MTILELAYYRVTQNGMAQREAMQMLETFARTATGQTLDWDGVAPRLTNDQCDLIDHAAVAYLNARGLWASVPLKTPEREAHAYDGKAAAMPRGDE